MSAIGRSIGVGQARPSAPGLETLGSVACEDDVLRLDPELADPFAVDP
jgi:hypothetical protein